MSFKDIYEAKMYGANIYAAGVFRGRDRINTFDGPWGEVVTLSIDTMLCLPYSPGEARFDYQTDVGTIDAMPGTVELDYRTHEL